MTSPEAPTRRILVVDDEPQIRSLLKRLLTMDGYDVLEAEDGHSALELAAKEPLDLVILDVMLPTRDGLDILGDLRRTSDVPVILLSARGDEADRVIGLKLGADDYVVKPFSAAELSARIESVLRRSITPRRGAGAHGSAGGGTGRCLRFDGLQIDLDTREVQVKGEVRRDHRQGVRPARLPGHLAPAGVLPPAAAGARLELVVGVAVGGHRHRAHPPAPPQDRSGPRPSPLGHHRPGRRLPVRALSGRL